MRVLLVNHTAEVSGGELSLLDLLRELPDDVDVLLASPPGRLQSAAQALGVPTKTIAGTAGSLRLHPLHTPLALAQMALAGEQLARASRAHRADVVHANTIRAGLVLAAAPGLRAARIAHVRDCLPPGAVSTATMRVIAARAHTMVANSQYTAQSVRAFAPRASVEVVHNPVDLTRWNAELIDRERSRASLGAAGTSGLLVGVVAQLSPWKGQDTAIEAIRLVRERGVDAHLLLIGSAKFLARSTRFDNEAYVRELHAAVVAGGLEQHVSFLGEREDVPELVRALDVLALPSSEEPFGRALIEAMALGVPVLATSRGGPPEIVTHGVEGLLVAPGAPAAWADALEQIAKTPDLGRAMGRAGRERARSAFSAAAHAQAMMRVYEAAASRRR